MNGLANLLGISQPIFQGPLGGGHSTAKLAAAVSNAGGLGAFGVYTLSPEEILRTAASIRELTDKPFNLNLWVSNTDCLGGPPSRDELGRMQARLAPFFDELGIEPPPVNVRTTHKFEEQARAVIEARPAVFSFVFGIPSPEIMREAKSKGILLAGSATTVDEAVTLEAAGVDVVIASGLEAGGHRPSFLATPEDSLIGTMALLPQVANAVRVPVVAAGGIANAQGVRAAMALGAQGVQVGTAFLACEESGAPEIHRKLLLEPSARNTVLSRVYSGRLARGIRNRIYDQLRDERSLPFPSQSWVVSTLREAALKQGRADLIALWCGQSAGLLKWTKAALVFQSLIEGLDRE